MTRFVPLLALLLVSCSTNWVPPPMSTQEATSTARPHGLPVYDHVVIVVEENKGYCDIIFDKQACPEASADAAPYINAKLHAEGATITNMYAEEHNSEGNYFWLYSGNNQGVQNDTIPLQVLTTSNLGMRLIGAGCSFKGYSEGLPEIGSTVESSGFYLRATFPWGAWRYVRRHVPWISFSSPPNGTTKVDSANLRFEDFPTDFRELPTVAFVIPNLQHDMHNGSIKDGDSWLEEHLDAYYQWAKNNNSLLILTFDEDSHGTIGSELTDPANQDLEKRNHITTIFAGAHIKPGYREAKPATHVNLLRTIEAMYELPRSGAQQPLAFKAGIDDSYISTDIFEP